MILFLDFDGVLHPESSGQSTDEAQAISHFCHLPRLESLLREFPRVDIVISSMWRERVDVASLLAYFSGDIRPRILGTTALSERTSAGYRRARREEEIISWLYANGAIDLPWVALDDSDWQFKKHLNCLVTCDPDIGFDDAAHAGLRKHFEKWLLL